MFGCAISAFRPCPAASRRRIFYCQAKKAATGKASTGKKEGKKVRLPARDMLLTSTVYMAIMPVRSACLTQTALLFDAEQAEGAAG